MSEPAWTGRPPQRLLLATDLGARCDRALDRAVQLAREWRSELVVLTVLEFPERPDPLAVTAWPPVNDDEDRLRLARQQLARDAASLDVPATVRIARGDAARVIGEVAAETDCGLIVAGMARNETFGRFLVGSTVERLARAVPQPVAVVRNRVHAPYRRVLVATDFSDGSRRALQVAASLFPGRELILYHAHRIPFSGMADDAAQHRIGEDIADRECAEFLAGSGLPAEARAGIRVVIERGGVEVALSRYVREQDIDLAVLGTHGRAGLQNVLLGSAAARLLDWLPCDTMVVRKPREG